MSIMKRQKEKIYGQSRIRENDNQVNEYFLRQWHELSNNDAQIRAIRTIISQFDVASATIDKVKRIIEPQRTVQIDFPETVAECKKLLASLTRSPMITGWYLHQKALQDLQNSLEAGGPTALRQDVISWELQGKLAHLRFSNAVLSFAKYFYNCAFAKAHGKKCPTAEQFLGAINNATLTLLHLYNPDNHGDFEAYLQARFESIFLTITR
jgi:hypothetical protein